MREMNCDHDDTVDGSGNLLGFFDASADFGPGAVAVTCPCGGWIVEDASGQLLAASENIAASTVTALLAA